MTDIPGNSSTTARIAVGGSTNGSLEYAGDHDWYRIDLTGGQSITIALNALLSNGVEDPYLRLYDSAGNLVYENDDGGDGLNSRLSFTASQSGTYYIDVGSYADMDDGDYQLSVSTYSPPPVGDMDLLAEQLVSGYWNGDVHHFNARQGGTISVDLTALTSAGQMLARAALALWSDVTGVNFQEVSYGGQITFDDNEPGAFAEASWSGDITTSAFVNVSVDWLADYGTGLNSYSFQTYIHEVGHALGLGHAGSYNGDGQYPFDVVYQVDGWPASVMSYFDQRESSYWADQGFTRSYVATPMMADIIAMAELYGLSSTTRTGDTTYGFNSNAGRDVFNAELYPDFAVTIFDSAGDDTLDYSGFSTDQQINLTAETFSNVGDGIGNLGIARGVTIENAIGGAGNDTLTGNSANNVLRGNAGNDRLEGGSGNDFLVGGAGADDLDGGAGNDIYEISSVAERFGSEIDDSGTSGIDEIRFAATGAAQTLNVYAGDTGIERIVIGTGTAAAAVITGLGAHGIDARALGNAVTIVGNSGDNTLYSTEYGDTIDGGNGEDRFYAFGGNDWIDGGLGRDVMYGGMGNDTYVVEHESDAPIEDAGQGIDTVLASRAHTLKDNVEHLQMTGVYSIHGRGNDLANTMTGNSGSNRMWGGAGNDTLVGYDGNDQLDGEAGGDTLMGGLGNDIYLVDSYSDSTVENAGEGRDTVRTTIGWTLGANLEWLELEGTGSINGTGNSLANVLRGNVGANSLYGAGANDKIYAAAGNDLVDGGDGNDWLEGEEGQDSYYGGSGSDRFVFRDGDFGGATGASADVIHDFGDADGDRIHLGVVDADTGLDGNQAFEFLGTGAFTGTAGELRYQQISGHTYVQGDTDGDGAADFWIRLDGLHTLGSDDFVF